MAFPSMVEWKVSGEGLLSQRESEQLASEIHLLVKLWLLVRNDHGHF